MDKPESKKTGGKGKSGKEKEVEKKSSSKRKLEVDVGNNNDGDPIQQEKVTIAERIQMTGEKDIGAVNLKTSTIR
eukprot:9953801-Ditylum_brightwellii.AAC.2